MGTANEYLYHLCRNKVLIDSYQMEAETMVCDVNDRKTTTVEPAEPESKKYKRSHFENCIIMHSVFHDKSR